MPVVIMTSCSKKMKNSKHNDDRRLLQNWRSRWRPSKRRPHDHEPSIQDRTNPKHETLNPKLESLNAKHETLIPKLETLNPKHETLNPKPL